MTPPDEDANDMTDVFEAHRARLVRLAYRMPMHNLGAWVSGFGLVVLIGIGAGVLFRRRRPNA